MEYELFGLGSLVFLTALAICAVIGLLTLAGAA
jgi:hypothetical protein